MNMRFVGLSLIPPAPFAKGEGDSPTNRKSNE